MLEWMVKSPSSGVKIHKLGTLNNVANDSKETPVNLGCSFYKHTLFVSGCYGVQKVKEGSDISLRVSTIKRAIVEHFQSI